MNGKKQKQESALSDVMMRGRKNAPPKRAKNDVVKAVRSSKVSALADVMMRGRKNAPPKRAKSEPVVKSIRPSKVPALLRSGAFFESLDTEDDSPVQVPASKANLIVRTKKDLDKLLTCLRFWGVDTIPDKVLTALIVTKWVFLTPALVEKYKMCFPVLETIRKFQYIRGDATMIGKAIQVESVEIIEFLLRRGFEFPADACDQAAEQGFVKLVQLAHQKGVAVTKTTFAKAAKKGNLDVIKYLWEVKCPHEGDIVESIAYSDNMDSVNYAIANIPFIPQGKVCYLLAYQNKFDMLKRMHSAGYALGTDALHNAAMWGRLPIFQYAHESGVAWSAHDLYVAGAHGHVHIVEYALQHGCPHDPAVLSKLRMH